MEHITKSTIVARLLTEGRPFIVASYATSKLVVGSRVSKESGKVEEFASIRHGLIIDDEVRPIVETLKNERLSMALKLPRNPDGTVDKKAAAKYIGIPAGSQCVLLVKTYVWEEAGKKMQLRISGDVLPLS